MMYLIQCVYTNWMVCVGTFTWAFGRNALFNTRNQFHQVSAGVAFIRNSIDSVIVVFGEGYIGMHKNHLKPGETGSNKIVTVSYVSPEFKTVSPYCPLLSSAFKR